LREEEINVIDRVSEVVEKVEALLPAAHGFKVLH
jgi:hypothetical protein